MDSKAGGNVGVIGVVPVADEVSATFFLLCLVLVWSSDLSSGITIGSFSAV